MNVTKIDRYAGSNIFSIFGQLEEVVALMMINEGKARCIPYEQFPDIKMSPDLHYNEHGQRAKFAIHVSKLQEAEFDNRIALLRM